MFTHDAIVHFEPREGEFVAQTLGHVRRLDDVGEHDRAGAGVVLVRTGHDRGADAVDRGVAHERFGQFFRDLKNPRGAKTVRLVMDAVGGLGAWCVAKAIEFALLHVHPIFDVIDTMLALCRHIALVRLGDVFGRQTGNVVNVDVGRHAPP